MPKAKTRPGDTASVRALKKHEAESLTTLGRFPGPFWPLSHLFQLSLILVSSL